ncbi:MAG TPA: sigma-70 family RNA polymerase sigma factor [Haliangium sp.]|nr:sigma-70 family RNA polymerase sigma factor [Haliangium sp.]
MVQPSPSQVTQMLQRWGAGDARALDDLFPVVYEELRRLAKRYMRSERQNHTLETGALVHEAYVRLIGQDYIEWRNRAHFYAIAASTMRRILVDHARTRGYQKRGGDVSMDPLEAALNVTEDPPLDLIALDQALTALAQLDFQKAELVELRFFGGLTNEEIAELQGTSLSSVERQWRLARAWLYRALKE